MLPLIKTASEIQNFFESESWQFCFIGGLALQRWGEERVTKDVDITLLTGFGDEEKFVIKMLDKFQSRIENAQEFAVERASLHQYSTDIFLKTCSAEDLIVMKAFADRTRDWADIESVVQTQFTLDWKYIYEQLEPLVELKYEPEILNKLQRTKTKYYQK